MSYRCAACRTIVGPRKKLLRHVTYRVVSNRKDVASETPVCSSCKQRLDDGTTLATIRQQQAAVIATSDNGSKLLKREVVERSTAPTYSKPTF